MINICTLCDKNYLLKGLALRQSLDVTLKGDYKLYWLCLDDETFKALDLLNDERLTLFKLSDLEQGDRRLTDLRDFGKPSNYGSQRDNYIWALTPYFVHYVLHNLIEENQYLMYCDSDIYFYHSPQIILDVMNGKSIGIHTHRFGPNRKKLDVGWYNVGVTVFKKDVDGGSACEHWRFWLLNPANGYYKEYGTCGDQKYLELFPHLWPNHTCVFDEDMRISHRAPWCCDEDGRQVLFFHFSHFTYPPDLSSWSDSIRGEWRPASHKHIRPYYEEYFEVIKQVDKLIQ